MISKIITDNLILRNATINDLDEIYSNVWKDYDLAKYMLWQVSTDLEEAKNRLDRTIKYQLSNDVFFVTLKSTGEVIGFGGIIKKDDDVYEDTGLCICKKYQQKGYGKELLKALEKIVFEEYNGKRFIYSCFKENEPSQKLCKSLGFKYMFSTPGIRDYDNYNYICNYYNLDLPDYKMNNQIEIRKD